MIDFIETKGKSWKKLIFSLRYPSFTLTRLHEVEVRIDMLSFSCLRSQNYPPDSGPSNFRKKSGQPDM
jgi:hypothetical protein